MQLEPLDARRLLSASLDGSFGTAGLRSFDFGSGDDFGYSVAVQSDGRILAAGTVRGTNGTTDFGLVRFLPDGSLDTSFGTGGFVTTDFGLTSPSVDEARSLVVDSSGRIYVAGWANRNSGTGNDFAVARYHPDGSLDAAFGAGGKVVSHFSGHDQAMAMALQADGRLVLAGLIGNDFGVARYNPDGSFDTSFGTGGFVRTALGTGLDMATCLALGEDGKIYAGGYVQFTTTSLDFAAAVYNFDGSPDTSFNGTGRIVLSIVGTVDQATSIALLGDGRFALAGRTNGNVLIVRYNADGTRDRTFTANGMATIDLGGTADTANAIRLLSDGSMLLAGAAGDAGAGRDFALFQVTPTGTLDPTFGSGGIVRNDFAGHFDEAFAMAMGSDGRIVVLGRTNSGGGATGANDFGLARYSLASNAAPHAVISGPNSVAEGSSVLLDGSLSFDPDGSIISYEWDFNYDGSSFTVESSGSSVTFSAAELDGPTTRVVALRVWDDGGASHIVTHLMQVTNVAPSLSLSGPGSAVRRQELTFSVSYADPGAGDTHRLRWDFGDGTIIETDAAGGAASMSHTYASTGNFTVIVTVFDDDGGSSSTQMNVNVASYGLVPDPQHPGKMMFLFNGTEADDKIKFLAAANGAVELRVNNQKLAFFNVTSRIVAYGDGGHDEIVADEVLAVPVQFYGGAGNDVLRGGMRGDTLDGGDGDDRIWGRLGNDLLVGGAGNDILMGEEGDDTLIGGAGRDSLKDTQGNNVFIDGADGDEEDDELVAAPGPGKSKGK